MKEKIIDKLFNAVKPYVGRYRDNNMEGVNYVIDAMNTLLQSVNILEDTNFELSLTGEDFIPIAQEEYTYKEYAIAINENGYAFINGNIICYPTDNDYEYDVDVELW